jgi:hypothetical protein
VSDPAHRARSVASAREFGGPTVPDDPGFVDRSAPEAVAPGLLRLLDELAPSGRYTAASLLEGPR